MSEEFFDQDPRAIHKRVGGWFDAFVNSPQYEPLTEVQRDKAPGIVRFFADFAFKHLGMTPERWDGSGLTECCVEIFPRKMSAGPAFFEAVAPVLSAFFTVLAEQGLLNNARTLAQTVAGLDAEIVAASQDKRNWGPAKTIVMAAKEAGVDTDDQTAMNQFRVLYTLQMLARLGSAPKAKGRSPTTAGHPAQTTSVRPSEPKVGRNAPCPCGSGKKFKKCCGG